MSKTITFAALKGGVGKTTLSYQFGNYLAKSNPKNKVLLIDLDHQSNLSDVMEPLMTEEQIKKGNIADVYASEINHNDVQNTGVTPQKLATSDDKQLYGLVADSRLVNMENDLTNKNKGNGASLLGYLVTQGYDKEFDYIIIDTHPTLEDVYVNGALICSDEVFTPVEPSTYGMKTIVRMNKRYQALKEQNVSTLTREPLITAKLHWLGNLIDFTSSEGIGFLNAVKSSDNFVAYFHERAVFNKCAFTSEYVIDHLDNKKQSTIGDKRAKKEILTGFKAMEDTIDAKSSVRSETNGKQ